jgi:Zinc finger, C2H2 type
LPLSTRLIGLLTHLKETKLGPNISSQDIDFPPRPPRRTRSSSRKPKMHQCQTCKKWFPRPSGLATHMNVHSGAKRESMILPQVAACRDVLLPVAFTCPVQSCNKKFAVRSNAKRHLRTHGIMPTPDMSFVSTPAEDNDIAAVPDPICWIPRSLKERNLKLESLDTCPLLISELPLVRPSTYTWGGEVVYEERDSFAEAPIAPYHPVYVCCIVLTSSLGLVTDAQHRFRSGNAYLGQPRRQRPRALGPLLEHPARLSFYRETSLSYHCS